MAPRGLFSFEAKTQFCASQGLRLARSRCFEPPEAKGRGDTWGIKSPEAEGRCNTWGIKPPDFSLKLYRSVSVLQKKERKTCANPAAAQTTETKRRSGTFLPKVLQESYKKKDPAGFVTLFRPPGALESELMFVKTGKFPPETYKNPKPHSFRPLDEDLPEIVTKYERDPGNLNFKLKHLDTLRTIRSDLDFSPRDTRTRMDTFKPPEPKWDARLLLPPSSWPPESASYTRHQRRRGAYSAFLDRVEEKLSRSWKNGP